MENEMRLIFPPRFFLGAGMSGQTFPGYLKSSDWGVFERKLGRIKDGSLSRMVCDLFGHNADIPSCITLAQELKLNALRFCIDWTSVQPEKNRWDDGVLQNYANAVDALLLAGITPLLWLWHFVLPQWIADDGGWANPATIQRFVRYAERVLDALGAKIKYLGTFNEPSGVLYMGYVEGLWPPEKKNDWRGLRLAKKHLVMAHRRTFLLTKKHFPHIKVGMAFNISFDEPYRVWHPGDIFLAWLKHRTEYNDFMFLERTQKSLDFIGLNYYFHNCYKFVLRPRKGFYERRNENKVMSDLNWEVYPSGIKEVLLQLRCFQKPIIVTENGVADSSDALRPDFITEHLRCVLEAMAQGAEVLGFIFWTLIRNSELLEGFSAKSDFGLYDINGNRRPSADLYRRIIELQQGTIF